MALTQVIDSTGPRMNMVRFHGIFAPRSSANGGSDDAPPAGLVPPRYRRPWHELLKRIFLVDVETCSRCGGRMKLVEIANDRHDIARVLALHGLGPDPPDEADPMPVGQMALVFA